MQLGGAFAAVTDITAIEIPKPLNWQDFQRQCVVLFRSLLGDERLQEWGSEGQTQHGIDLFGYRRGSPSTPVGVQCRRLDRQLSGAKMRSDAEEARAIQPPLTELIFATTAKRDTRIQQEANQLTQELHQSGWPCRVTVMAWQDLHLEIVRHPDALRAFWPQGAAIEPLGDIIRQETATVVAKVDQQTALLLDLREELSRARASGPVVHDPELPPEAQTEPAPLHTRITALRELVRHGKTRSAIQGLERLLQQEAGLPAYARYRVISNIASAHFAAGRFNEARAYWRRAFDLRPDDHKAQTNLAFADLACGDRAGATSRAEAVLLAHPDHAAAAAVLIHARSTDVAVSDPFALLPAACRRTEDVLTAVITFLRAKDDPGWRTRAADAHAAHPDNEVLDQFATEAELQPILADVSIMLGKPAAPDMFATVRRCAGRLSDPGSPGRPRT
jgi:tetratricopeptide (TPR) repeat protein